MFSASQQAPDGNRLFSSPLQGGGFAVLFRTSLVVWTWLQNKTLTGAWGENMGQEVEDEHEKQPSLQPQKWKNWPFQHLQKPGKGLVPSVLRKSFHWGCFWQPPAQQTSSNPWFTRNKLSWRSAGTLFWDRKLQVLGLGTAGGWPSRAVSIWDLHREWSFPASPPCPAGSGQGWDAAAAPGVCSSLGMEMDEGV